MNPFKPVLAIVIVIGFSPSVFAQLETEGITAAATAKTEADADVMRMTLTVEAQGADFKSAMSSLAEKKKNSMIKLEKLDAVEDSIEFGQVKTGESGDTSAMRQQMKRRLGNDPRMAKMMKVKPPVKLTIQVTADWALEGKSDELLMICDELKQKVTDADVGLAKEKEELSEEQAELAEEMAEMMNNYGGGNETQAGTPTFYYVRTVLQEDHDKLISEAFEKAKSKAERLAKATEVELGKVKMIVSQKDAMPDFSEYGYSPYGRRTSTAQGGPKEDGSIEAVAQSPINLPYSVAIAVAYEIKQ